jgi:hypothetical protein
MLLAFGVIGGPSLMGTNAEIKKNLIAPIDKWN